MNRVLLMVFLALLALPARADSTAYTDLPLRTLNRSKPNVILLLDNDKQSQRTYAPDNFPNSLFPGITGSVSLGGASAKNNAGVSWTTLVSPDTRFTTMSRISNVDSLADTDWHYRSSCWESDDPSNTTKTAWNALSSTQQAACTAGKFNKLYFDPYFDYNAYRPSLPQGVGQTLGQAPTPWEIVSALNANGTFTLTAQQTAQLYGCYKSNASCAPGSNGTSTSKNADDGTGKCNAVWQRCAWVDGFNPDAGTLDTGSAFTTAPYPPLPNQIAPPSWQNWASSSASPNLPTSSSNVFNWKGQLSTAIGMASRTYNPDIGQVWGIVSPSGTGSTPTLNGFNEIGTVWGSSCSLIQTPGANPCQYCPSPCADGSASCGSVSTCASPVSLPVLPNSQFSPHYCDTSKLTAPYSFNDPYELNYSQDPCLNPLASGTEGPFSNPGEADFFDAGYDGKSNKGARHRINDNGDKYFGNNPSMGIGASQVTGNSAQQAANIRNFVLWHSFFRTRLMAMKSALAYSMANSGISSNFRVGLTTLVNGTQTGNGNSDGGAGTGDQITFGAYSADANYSYFSAVSEFNSAHKTEWYQQLQKVQPSPNASQPGYLMTLQGLYQWIAGTRPNPTPASGFLSQSDANSNASYNAGVLSQYLTVTDPNNANQTVTLTPARTGPFLYSCQNNILTFLTSSWIGMASGTAYNLKSDASQGAIDPYPTANASSPYVTGSGNLYLPSYVGSVCDPTAYPSDSGKTCKTLQNTAGSGLSSNPWPYPFLAPSSAGYSSPAWSSFSDVALFYWSQDINEQFNRYLASRGSHLSVPVLNVTGGTGGSRQGAKPFGQDTVATWPHVTTNVVTLAIGGTKSYTDSSGHLISPSNSDRTSGSSLYSSGNWPTLSYYDPYNSAAATNISSYDDMVHAAVNGHGSFTSTHDVSSLNSALSSFWTNVLSLSGSESAVAVANPQVSQTGTSYAFQSSYNTSGWWGDLVASPIQPTTGIIATYRYNTTTCTSVDANGNADSTNPGWSALCQLRNQLCPAYSCATPGANQATARAIVTDKGDGSTGPGMEFAAANLTASQFNVYGSDSANVIAWLRGDSSNENCAAGATTGYRCRYQNGNTVGYWNPLGDIVDAEAVAIGPPLSSFSDAGYAAFKSSQAGRAPIIFQAANDGFLHAILIGNGTTGDTTRGKESWAYVPSFVLPNLKNLAMQGYTHLNFVNATPTFGDVNLGGGDGDWHTLLIGGLGKGGRGYYALDVTTPSATSVSDAASKVLWTFPNSASNNTACTSLGANMGYTYGRPVLVKAKVSGAMKWVAMVSSGYDNGASTGGDGKGHIYILDPKSGTCLADMATSAGSSATPIGLAYIAAQVSSPGADETVVAVYAGDLLGNVWKFAPAAPTTSTDISTWTVTKFAVLKDADHGRAQPVTSEPNIALIGNVPVIYVGTGRYLGTGDVPTTTNYKSAANYVGQTVYALADNGTDYATSSARAAITALNGNYRINGDCTDTNGALTSTCNFGPQYCSVNSPLVRCFSPSTQTTLSGLTTVHPWLFDLPAGEEIITNPLIVLGSLMFTSNQPVSDPCQPGGKSYFYMLNYLTGGAISGAFVSQIILDPVSNDNVMASRPTIIQLPDGRTVALISTSSGGGTVQLGNQGGLNNPPARRVSWREVPNQ